MAARVHRIWYTHRLQLRMRALKAATVAVFVCFVLGSAASAATVQVQAKAATRKVHHRRVQNASVTHARARQVTSGTQVIREKLVQLSTAIRETELDCSHFANYVYQQVGLLYDYAPSAELYRGAAPFVRVQHAQPGDLIVFGDSHVGIVKEVLPSGQIATIEGNYENKVSANVRSAGEATGYVNVG